MSEGNEARGDSRDSLPRIEHGAHADTGRCRDCAQGIIGKVRDGFEYFSEDEDNDGRGFWFCCYCGSNHVEVVFNGVEIDQGDLYDEGGFLNFWGCPELYTR